MYCLSSRVTDGGPPSDFNLCATERGYSIQTALPILPRERCLKTNNTAGIRMADYLVRRLLPLTGAPLHTRSAADLLKPIEYRIILKETGANAVSNSEEEVRQYL